MAYIESSNIIESFLKKSPVVSSEYGARWLVQDPEEEGREGKSQWLHSGKRVNFPWSREGEKSYQ